MILTGQATTNTRTTGQDVDIKIGWTYPNSNPSIFEGVDQPATPPVELGSVEIRLTGDGTALVNTEDSSIKWLTHFHGTNDEPTADYIGGYWVGRDDVAIIKGLPVKPAWYFQARTWSRSGIPSDWTLINTIIDSPQPLPAPVLTSIMTNTKNQVRLEWTDVAVLINNFSHYEIAKEELDVTRRLETNAVIVGES